MSSALQRLSQELFALSGAVTICRIEKIDAGVEGGIDYGRRSGSVCPPAEVVASDANKRHVQRSELSIFHGAGLCPTGSRSSSRLRPSRRR